MSHSFDDGHSAAPTGRVRGLLHRIGWKIWAIAAVVLLAVAGLAVYFAGQADLRARLMRADPDTIAADPELRQFAIATGQPAYNRNCASCHGDHMQGDRSRGAPNLADDDWLYGDGRAVQIERTILYGIRSGNPKAWNLADMPGFAEPVPYKRYQVDPLEPADINDVVEFVLMGAGKAADKDAAARGAAIFATRGQCFDCHSQDAKGDSAIGAPNLVDDIWLLGNGTRDDIHRTVSHGNAGACPAWASQLDPVTIRALAVLIYAASHKDAPQASSQSTGGPAG